MNIKVTYSDKKINKDRLYGAFCSIIKQEETKEKEEVQSNEKEYCATAS